MTNEYFNTTNATNNTVDPFNGYFKFIHYFSIFYQIFIIFIGLIGNTITILIFSQTKQTPRKTSFYLISLAVNDILCLITIFLKVCTILPLTIDIVRILSLSFKKILVMD